MPRVEAEQEPDDEWVFSLRVPDSVLITPSNISATTINDNGGSWVELRQRQPPASPRRSDFLDKGFEVSLTTSQQGGEEEEERVQLLPTSADDDDEDDDDFDKATEQEFPPSPTTSAPVWRLQSPFWSLQSETLLSITYCSAWQALPEFTEQCTTACCSKSPLSLARVCGVRTCGRAATKDYVQETFTVRDIVKINQQHSTKEDIPGIGLCKTLQICLRPMATAQHDSEDVPAHLQEAWEAHIERMNGPCVRQEIAASSPVTHSRQQTVEEEDDKNKNIPTHDGPILTFCLPTKQTDPPLLWKVSLPEVASHSIAVETITVLDGQLSRMPSNKDRPTHIYINGFQSWSFGGSLLRGQPQPGPALPDMFSRAFNTGGSPPPPAATTILTSDDEDAAEIVFRPHYQSDFFTCITSDGRVAPRFSKERKFPFQQLDETGGPALLLGWLSQHEQFGVVSVDKGLSRVRMHCSADGQILHHKITGGLTTDWAYAQLVHPHSYDEEPMANYLHAVAGYHNAKPLDRVGLLTGWCSWYVYYEKINAGLLRDNFARLAAMRDHVPTNVAVVDDGYMTAWGDWDSLKPKEFPAGAGLDVVARDIHAQRMRPGLWLAPFAADKHSQVVRDHPDWVIRNDAGVAANSSNCGKFFYGLDATNPAVRQHVHKSIRRAVQDWGFNVLKIDFLYACCLEGNGKYDLSVGRAQAMHLALQTIRDAAGPDVFLIGCGCPIASGIGYIDAMRVSADTGPTWRAALPLPWWDNGTLPSLRGMIRNTIARAPFGHRWWHNDPDCLMLGSHTSLTDDQVASAASVVAMTCGMLLLSDDLPTLSPARLSIVSKIFPLTGVSATVLDLHSTNDGLPSLLRLWCTDRYNLFESLNNEVDQRNGDGVAKDHNATATFFARQASFRPDAEPTDPSERRRNCIHVAKGMGTWTVVSLSNWSSKSVMLTIPPPALSPPPTHGWGDDRSTDSGLDDDEDFHGYHVFAFWSSKYSWIANTNADEDGEDDFEHSVGKLLRPHETEVFHIKKVTPDAAQYIGT